MEKLRHFSLVTVNSKEDEQSLVIIVGTVMLGLLVLLVIFLPTTMKNDDKSTTKIHKSVVSQAAEQQGQSSPKTPGRSSTSTTIKTKKREICQCPFSKESSFVVEMAEDLLEPTPLDKYDDWWDQQQQKQQKKQQQPSNLGLRWLAYGVSGQDHPGYIRAQLKRFRHHKHFLLVDHHTLEEELDLKDKWLDAYDGSTDNHSTTTNQQQKRCFVMEDHSLQAQQETLELFIAYLTTRFPDIYEYDKSKHAITVYNTTTTTTTTSRSTTGTATTPASSTTTSATDEKDRGNNRSKSFPILRTYHISDWWDTRPLELCSRIVQEDLILMRHSPSTKSYNMAAASVVFSFTELDEKLSTDTNFIHSPVPNFQQHLAKVLYLSFQSLQVEKPLWRNNWTIVPMGQLDEPSDAFTHQQEIQDLQSLQHPRDRYLKVEYQTIRRLPQNSQYLLFTVRTFTDPMAALEVEEPEEDPKHRVASKEEEEEEAGVEKMMMVRAAATLASSIRGLSLATLQYKGVESKEAKDDILQYLDSIVAKTNEQNSNNNENKDTTR